MSTIKSKEDGAYSVNSDDLIPLVNNAGTEGKSVTPAQLARSSSAWTLIESIDLSGGEVAGFDFTGIPVGARLIKIEGIIAANATTAFRPAIRLNGDSGPVYEYIKNGFAETVTTTESETDVTSIPFSSAWSNDEEVIFEMVISVTPSNGAQSSVTVKSSTFNNGGAGDYHITGGWAALGGPLTEVNFITISPFISDYGVNTRLHMSAMF